MYPYNSFWGLAVFAHKRLRACAGSEQQTGSGFTRLFRPDLPLIDGSGVEGEMRGDSWLRGGRLTQGWFGHMAYH